MIDFESDFARDYEEEAANRILIETGDDIDECPCDLEFNGLPHPKSAHGAEEQK